MTGSVWNPSGNAIVQSNLQRVAQTFIAAAGQTVFTLTTQYVYGGQNLEIFKNGLLVPPGSVTEDVGGFIFTLAPCALNDVIVAVSFTGSTASIATLAAQAQASQTAAAASAAAAAASAAAISGLSGTVVGAGNLTFATTAQRIVGDFSNVAYGSRLGFQSSITNGNTIPFLVPNGTGTDVGFEYGSSYFKLQRAGTTRFQLGAAANSSQDIIQATSGPDGSALSHRNRLHNGNFLINQRYGAASQGLPLGTFTPASDRWFAYISGAAGTFQTTTGAGPNADILTNVLSITGTAGSVTPQFIQRIESVNSRDLAGKTVTLSFWAIQTTGTTLNVAAIAQRANTTDVFSPTPVDGNFIFTSMALPSGVWTKFVGTLTLTSAATTGLQINISIVGTLNTALAQIAYVQLEQGSAPTPFIVRDYGTELALCQRYLPVLPTNGTLSYIGTANALSTISSAIIISLPVATRVPCTGVSGAVATGITQQFGAQAPISTGVSINGATSQTMVCLATSFNAITTPSGGIAYANAAQTTPIVFTGAEL
jgi:hypothetical protein